MIWADGGGGCGPGRTPRGSAFPLQQDGVGDPDLARSCRGAACPMRSASSLVSPAERLSSAAVIPTRSLCSSVSSAEFVVEPLQGLEVGHLQGAVRSRISPSSSRRCPSRRRWIRRVSRQLSTRRPTSVVSKGLVRKSVAPAPRASRRALAVTSAERMRTVGTPPARAVRPPHGAARGRHMGHVQVEQDDVGGWSTNMPRKSRGSVVLRIR